MHSIDKYSQIPKFLRQKKQKSTEYTKNKQYGIRFSTTEFAN